MSLEAAVSNRRADALVVALATCAAMIGGLAIAGYAWNLPALIRPLDDTPATCLAIAIATMLAVPRSSPKASGAYPRPGLCFSVRLLRSSASSAPSKIWPGVSLGIDAPALHRALGLIGATPGRPALVVCACLILVGGGLITLPRANNRWVALAVAAAAILAALLGAMSLAGYLVHAGISVNWPAESQPMPPSAAFGLVMLGLGLWRALLLRVRATARPDARAEGRRIFSPRCGCCR